MTRANLGLSAILVLAVLQRIVYLAIYPDVMPFFAHPLADARIYESWSSAIDDESREERTTGWA